jgi:uncharacterized protein
MASNSELTSAEAVRAHYGQPSHMSTAKELDRLDKHCRAFIALSPFLVIASSDRAGRLDASPRGDAPGFVAVLDDRRLLIPDRLGNNRVDTMMNIAENPHVGLLFLTPGINESLRVNGAVQIVTDPDVLSPLAAQGKMPKAGLLVAVEEVFFQCGKAMIRSKLWRPESLAQKGSFPTLGKILAEQIEGGDAERYDAGIEERYRTALY